MPGERPACADSRLCSHHGDPRRAIGRLGEDLALKHFRALGFEPVARNHRTRYGEIDLIVCDGRVLVFAEVKTRVARPLDRAGPAATAPLDGIRWRQQARLRRLIAAWLKETRARPHPGEIRADAVGVLLDEQQRLLRLDHVQGVL